MLASSEDCAEVASEQFLEILGAFKLNSKRWIFQTGATSFQCCRGQTARHILLPMWYNFVFKSQSDPLLVWGTNREGDLLLETKRSKRLSECFDVVLALCFFYIIIYTICHWRRWRRETTTYNFVGPLLINNIYLFTIVPLN